jgi:translation initiation factor 3 subunit M
MTTFVTAFIDISEEEQAQELKEYWISHGASFDDELGTDGDICRLVLSAASSFSACLANASDEDAESLLNCILSFCFAVKKNEFLAVLQSLSDNLSSGITEGNKQSRFHLLNVLFAAMDQTCPIRLDVWMTLLPLSVELNCPLTELASLKQLNTWLVLWNTEKLKAREAYRVLHRTLRHFRKREASDVQISLLKTYDVEEASTATDDAHRCIVDVIADPEALLLDHLLALPPIKSLKGTDIYKLLTIFVSGTLSDYTNFYEAHQDFIESQGKDIFVQWSQSQMNSMKHLVTLHHSFSF